jgi:hypothetical protein
MPMSVMVEYGKGTTVCVHTILEYRGVEVQLYSFLTPPALYQGKEPLAPLNRRLNVPQNWSGCCKQGINPLSLLKIE